MDVLLHIVTLALLPSIMTLLGINLAVKSIPEQKQKRTVILQFCFLLVLTVIFVAVSELRSDLAQQKRDDNIISLNKEVQQLAQDYFHPLPSLELQTISSSLKGIEEKLKIPLKLVVRTSPVTPTIDRKLQMMSSLEFRNYALGWTKQLREFENHFMADEFSNTSNIPMFGQDQAARESYMSIFTENLIRRNQDHLTKYKNEYWGESVAIYNELGRRYKAAGKPLPEPGQIVPFALADGNLIKNTLSGGLIGPDPIGGLADYLDLLVRNLPS